MIEARQLTKRFGAVPAVSEASFDVPPGIVTGFVGPNGAGKTTTMRMILGLDHPSGGEVRVNGRRYDDLVAPLREVGALIDAGAVHKGRRAVAHLEWMARSNRIPRSRVREVLATVGLDAVGSRRVKGYSLGMAQRLGIAGALLGDPPVLLFDEPINGLDPQGIVWCRTLLRTLAREGRSVLVSSHLMSEMALTADRLLVIGRGRILADTTVDEMVAANSNRSVRVRAADQDRLARRMIELGAGVSRADDGSLTVTGPDSAWIGQLAASEGLVLHELTPQSATLEEAFMNLTGSSVDYVAGAPDTRAGLAGGVVTTAVRPMAPCFGDLLAAEWIKLRSLRSSVVAMAVTVVLVVGIGVLVCVAIAATADASTTIDDPTSVSLVGVTVAQLSVAVFGVLVVTSEYSSGTIKVSLMAVPRRSRLLASKSVVVVAVAVVVGEVVAWLSFGAGQAILSGSVSSASVSQPGVVRAVAGAGLLLGLLALFGSAVGWLVRSAAAAISIVVGVLFVLPAVLQAIPGRVGADFQHFWPTVAGGRILVVNPTGQPSGEPGAWVGLGILALFVAAVLLGAGAILAQRDA